MFLYLCYGIVLNSILWFAKHNCNHKINIKDTHQNKRLYVSESLEEMNMVFYQRNKRILKYIIIIIIIISSSLLFIVLGPLRDFVIPCNLFFFSHLFPDERKKHTDINPIMTPTILPISSCKAIYLSIAPAVNSGQGFSYMPKTSAGDLKWLLWRAWLTWTVQSVSSFLSLSIWDNGGLKLKKSLYFAPTLA